MRLIKFIRDDIMFHIVSETHKQDLSASYLESIT